jgi:hypothetical protein
VMIQSLNASSLLVGVDGTLHTVERMEWTPNLRQPVNP